MSYSSLHSDRELYSYYVKGTPAVGATEYPMETETYTEYEGSYEFYFCRTYYFTDAEGEEHSWESEDDATDWLEANGYTNDY